MKKFLMAVGLLVAWSWASAQDNVDFYSLAATVPDAVEIKRGDGVILDIDYTTRRMTVGGFVYYLVPATDAQPLTVKMLGKDFGSLQMLEKGMHVQIDYIPAGDYRLGFDIVQIADSEVH